ncbi:ABC transporter [Arboricoccus pini]|uniref:ABC transporter n=1 Tax=Arboricoccus pini TaxID=1963835 RepID=A0A212QRE7_9PROT|nr:ABC transporter ATP-binding protein [Arboricoccus pini]SNB62158.1 ABC transporter [Arboricoccus pini]
MREQAGRSMESSIYAFVKRYSWRQQLIILGMSAVLLPLNYVTLELPKTIVNRALGENATPHYMGYNFDRLNLLWLLCGLFLAAVVVSGGLKYIVNVYAGIVSERMLRRLRYQLYEHMLRFPLAQFRRTSQGEIVQMINAETEPLGGFVAEAVSTPGLQGGTLLTTLVFIFVQNPILGMAAIALYPLQIYLIPKLQRQVNQLGKLRVQQVRRNAERISETVQGARDIHANDGTRYERARMAQQLGEVFWIRFDIYKKKFLIKFLNNFMAQFGPFLFYSVGGYLVLQGSITLGALVAIVSAHKDISAPWKELLAFYQGAYDVKIKYEQVVTQFMPPDLRRASRLDGDANERLKIETNLKVSKLSLQDENGDVLLENIDLEVELPTRLAVIGPAGSGKEDLILTLAGLHVPTTGKVTIGGRDLEELPEAVLGRAIGFIGSQPYIFAGTIYRNLVYGLMHEPVAPRPNVDEEAYKRDLSESRLSGNTTLDVEADWLGFDELGLTKPAQRRAEVMRALDLALLSDDVYRLGLRGRVGKALSPESVERILEARRLVEERLNQDPKLRRLIERFDQDRYNDNATLAENLLFGTLRGDDFDADHLTQYPYVLETLARTGLDKELMSVGLKIAETMVELFADLPPDHDYYRQFSFIAADDLPYYRALVSRAQPGRLDKLRRADQERLLMLPFKLVETRHRLGLLTEDLKAKVVAARHDFREHLPERLIDRVDFFDPDRLNEASSVQDNIIFGRIALGQAGAQQRIGQLIADIIDELELKPFIIEIGLEAQVGVSGSRLPVAQRQKLAIARAILKRPEMLIVADATGPLDIGEQPQVRDNILKEFEGRTVVWALHQHEWARDFEHVAVMDHGRLRAFGGYDEVMAKIEGPSAAPTGEAANDRADELGNANQSDAAPVAEAADRASHAAEEGEPGGSTQSGEKTSGTARAADSKEQRRREGVPASPAE